MKQRAWSLLTIEGAKQYGGNAGYADDPTSIYRYDSDVANHRQVQAGDIVIIRSQTEIFGVARVTEINTGQGIKERLRCPICRATNIKARLTMQPRWICKTGHTFDTPESENVSVVKYEAHYATTFVQTVLGFTTSQLNAAVLRPTDQMSIKEIDLSKIEQQLASDPRSRSLIRDFASRLTVDIRSTANEGDEQPESVIAARQRVLREISIRRGQAGFRKRLIRRYGESCQISHSIFMELVEAAHVDPYASTGDHSAHNGLLLRSDFHTLFDLSLLGIDPVSLQVNLHPSLIETEYSVYSKRKLFTNGTPGPSRTALGNRWDLYQERLQR